MSTNSNNAKDSPGQASEPRVVSVCVCGGGPVGLATAIALATPPQTATTSTGKTGDGYPDAPGASRPDEAWITAGHRYRVTVVEALAAPAERALLTERSYPMLISGHGLTCIEYIGAVGAFQSRMTKYGGMHIRLTGAKEVPPPHSLGWLGCHSNIVAALLAHAETRGLDLEIQWSTRVVATDAVTGTVETVPVGTGCGDDAHAPTPTKRQFDLIIGADGSGSTVRRDLVTAGHVPPPSVDNPGDMFNTSIRLDRVSSDPASDMHVAPGWVHLFSKPGKPTIVAGEVASSVATLDNKDATVVIAGVRTAQRLQFKTAAETRAWFDTKAPLVSRYISDKELERFRQRKPTNVSRVVLTSQWHAHRAVLVGDATATFPINGQGCNQGLEGASVLARMLRSHGPTAQAFDLYQRQWQPQTHACAQVARQIKYERVLPILWIVAQQKLLPWGSYVKLSSNRDVPYTAVWARERQLGFIWRALLVSVFVAVLAVWLA